MPLTISYIEVTAEQYCNSKQTAGVLVFRIWYLLQYSAVCQVYG